MDCIDGVRYIEAVGGLCPIRQTILIAQEFVPFTDEWYPLRRQDNASAEFLKALKKPGIAGSAVILGPLQDPIPQAQIVVDTDEIYALLRPRTEHAVEQV